MYFLQTYKHIFYKHIFLTNTYFTLGSSLFGSIKLTKNADSDKYKHSGYGMGFHSLSEFSLPVGSMGKMLLFLELI